MFGNKPQQPSPESSPQREVPVYTVHTMPRSYELLCTVFAGKVNTAYPSNVLQKLGAAGGAIPECDAVIGLVIAPIAANGQLVHAYGTAIRYTDRDGSPAI
ncbi:hypothetical protein [Cohnella sp. GCM10027633]|uniref:hypothetical protein n=1 Tax=unclassified Cohnella TaxID=2636738 RepID=UPI00362A87CB